MDEWIIGARGVYVRMAFQVWIEGRHERGGHWLYTKPVQETKELPYPR